MYFVALKGQEFLSTLSLRRATPSLYQLYDTYAISIHALLAESDDDLEPSTTRKLTFLSTLSLRRATRQNYECFKWIKFLSTLSLRRATPRNWRKPHEQKTFLSTLSLRRATLLINEHRTDIVLFLSTLSLRRATRPMLYPLHRQQHFYPRSPCGERP